MNYPLATEVANSNKEFRSAVKRCERYKSAVSLDESQKCATLGILKIGASITFASNVNKTAANFDIISLSKALSPNFRLHFITRKTRSTAIPKNTMFTDIFDAAHKINDLGLDALLIFNGSVNNWGGEPDEASILIWKCIQRFKGRVFYIHTDGLMRLHQIYDDGFVKRGWSERWPKDDVYIDRNDIVYLTQARSVSRIQSLINKGNGGAIKVEKKNIVYFPIQEASLLTKPKFRTERNIQWDLIYGGGLRNGRRRDVLIDWYFGHSELNVRLFGNMDPSKFQLPIDTPGMPSFGGPVSNVAFMSEMRKALATVHVTDNWYANHWVALRFYEALQSGVIPFVDHNADSKHLLYYPNSVLEDFLYVKRKSELIDRIQLIKREDCADEVLELCRDAIRMRWNRESYVDLLKNIITKRIF